MNIPAFKEWSVIVSALEAGAQILILRKGGIAEGRGAFQLSSEKFWLFPTRFHQQLEKTKPTAASWAPAAASPEITETGSVEIRCFAEVVHSAFLTDWPAVARLNSFHFWMEATVRERFEWGRPAGLHVFAVRVHRLQTPVTLPLTAEMAGCKSWIELPLAFHEHPSMPVLSDAEFQRSLTALSL